MDTPISTHGAYIDYSQRDTFIHALKPENVAVVIQSNLRLPTAEWQALLERVATSDRVGDIAGPPPSGSA